MLACSDRDKPAVKKEPERPRRVIEPLSRGVRALPPHAIRAEGVGPYKLGASAAEILDQLPSGPRIRQFTLPGIVHRDMLRSEDDAILIGTEPQGKAQFVAVVRGEIARTEAGIQVGSTREELERLLGAPVEEYERARDPRVVVPSKLDNAHVVVEGERIAAIVLTPPVERAKDPAATAHTCTRPPSDRAKRIFGACLTASGEQVRAGDDELSVVGKDAEKPVRIPVPGLVYAAALRNPTDGRDDVVAITRTDDGQARTWFLTYYRLLDGKLMRMIEPATLYQITAANARWIGAELDSVDVLIELVSKPDAIEVGGLLTTRVGDNIQDIVVISPVHVRRRRVKAAPPDPGDAGVSDGGTQGSANSEGPGL
jgi:hypothetical protein